MSTSAQSIVDAIDAAILAMVAGGGAQSITVEGRSITYTDLEQLRKARAFYSSLTSAAALDAGASRPVKVFGIRMGRPE